MGREQREIKFRAWDKTHKVMDVDWSKDMLLSSDGTLYEKFDDHFAGESFAAYRPTDNYILMQYTGLKDKNGKPIYEGDVVRKIPEEWPSKSDGDPRTLDQYLHDMSLVSVVEYRTDRFCLVRDGEYRDRIYAGQHGSVEVIGNIHQNPELLTHPKESS